MQRRRVEGRVGVTGTGQDDQFRLRALFPQRAVQPTALCDAHPPVGVPIRDEDLDYVLGRIVVQAQSEGPETGTERSASGGAAPVTAPGARPAPP